MSHRSWETRILDILNSIRNIQSFTHEMTLDSFLDDPKTIRACAFELSVIGEAVRLLPEELRHSHKNIPWNNIQAMRNKMIHEYFRIDEEILWYTIQNDLPPLIPLLQEMISKNSC